MDVVFSFIQIEKIIHDYVDEILNLITQLARLFLSAYRMKINHLPYFRIVRVQCNKKLGISFVFDT